MYKLPSRTISHPTTGNLGNTANSKRLPREPSSRGFRDSGPYSTVTLFARLRGWSTSVPLATAV
jgi:hypothetical protein